MHGKAAAEWLATTFRFRHWDILRAHPAVCQRSIQGFQATQEVRPNAMNLSLDNDERVLRIFGFRISTGWCGLCWNQDRVRNLWFGCEEDSSAEPPVRGIPVTARQLAEDQRDLVARLKAMFRGVRVAFADVRIDLGERSLFDRKVTAGCRRIAWGRTLTYAELAAKVGHPGAARAVGNVMRRNPIPLIVPCHRVVGAGGSLGGYSAPGGLATKRWLLDLESESNA